MVRFLRNWLVWILAGMMLLGIAIAFVPLSRREETRAKNELALLMDRAFETIQDGKAYADPVIAAEEENLLSKARAIVRFLEHDDALLSTDALLTLCEQLSIDRIDVANLQGELIASSDASRIGLSVGSQEAFAWTMTAADDPSASLVRADEADRSMLYACAGRTEIDGFVLLTRHDPFVDDALIKSGTDALLSELPYNGDLVFESTTGGEDGAFYDAGSLCVRKTLNGVTLIAARATGDVYRMRNTALAAVGTIAICMVICGVASYLLRLEPLITLDEEERDLENAARTNKINLDEEAPSGEAAIDVDLQEHEITAQHDRAKKQAPRQVKRHAGRKQPPDDGPDAGEDAFEQIVE